MTVASSGTSDLSGAHLHRATVPASDLAAIDGVAVTSVPRTLIDLGRHRPLATAVAAMDHALRKGMVTGAELEAVVLACWNWPRIGTA